MTLRISVLVKTGIRDRQTERGTDAEAERRTHTQHACTHEKGLCLLWCLRLTKFQEAFALHHHLTTRLEDTNPSLYSSPSGFFDHCESLWQPLPQLKKTPSSPYFNHSEAITTNDRGMSYIYIAYCIHTKITKQREKKPSLYAVKRSPPSFHSKNTLCTFLKALKH